jgi:hypothetical protein
MLEKKHIEAILKINGIKPTSPDEEIRSVLLSARYSEDEVDAAIIVLRENTVTKTTSIDGLHKVFHTNNALNSSEISALLGIDVNIDTLPEVTKKDELEPTHIVFITVSAIIIAFIGIFIAMYLYKVGIFYPTVE